MSAAIMRVIKIAPGLIWIVIGQREVIYLVFSVEM